MATSEGADRCKIRVQDLSVWYGNQAALRRLNLEVHRQEILGIIGPANSGKTSFLRALNRLLDQNPQARVEGQVLLDGRDIFRDMEVLELRRRVGIVFALPIPLPLSIFDNVAYGPRRHGLKSRRDLAEIVERSLRAAFLWEEVKDRLHSPAMELSGGQQQRLCIARTLAVQPEVILFDEPCSGLDPISTAQVEESMQQLKQHYTLVLVTNNVMQSARVADRTAFFLMGELVEIDETGKLFTNPADRRTEQYLLGRFG